MKCVFELRNISRRISDGFSLQEVSLAAQPGEVVGFVGANGAGKTTVIRALLGLIHIDSGEVCVFGKPFGTGEPNAVQRSVHSRIGVVFDSCPYPAELTVRQAMACVSPAFPAWDEGGFSHLLESFGISPKAKIKELSRGMGMKLQLAVALSHGAELLVLDEATAGLDPVARNEMLDMLREFASEGQHAALLSSHITTDLERIADRVVGIDAGRIAFNVSREAITDMAGIAHCSEAEAERILGTYESERHRACESSKGSVAQVSNGAGLTNGKAAHENTLFHVAQGASSPSDAVGPLAECDALELPISLPRAILREFSVDVLVSDRFAFAKQFPNVPCDRATIDDYLQFSLRGVRSL